MNRWTVRRFDAIDSTNRWLVERASEGAEDGLVAIADEQTAGRGRLGRTWTAPPGSALLMSVLLRPNLPVAQWHLLTFALADAALTSVRELGAQTATLKWPNDLVAIRPDGQERKLAGILAQAVHGEHPGVVLGIGVNVRRPQELPDDVAARGVWLDELGVGTDVRTLADAVLTNLDRVSAQTADQIVDRARATCTTLGRTVRVELPYGSVTGVAIGLTDDASLLVNDGTSTRVFSVGDVVHLRVE